MKISKVKVSSVIVSTVLLCATLISNATDYTSTDPNKNSTYNRDTAATFAVNNTYKPFSGMSYVSAKNSDGSSSEDCTNFVSHCLRAGGMPTTTFTTYSDLTKWTPHCATWENAHSFRSYWGNINGSGSNKCYSYKTYTIASAFPSNWGTIWNDLYKGDVCQWVFGSNAPVTGHSVGETGHSNIVYDYTTTVVNGKAYQDFFMAQHSHDDNTIHLINFILYTAPANWGTQGWVCTYKIKQ